MNNMYVKDNKNNKKKVLSIVKEFKKVNMDEEKIKEIQEFLNNLVEELYELQQITVMEFDRPYAKKYLKEQRKKWKKDNPERAKKGEGLLYPDSESIYKDYYDLKGKLGIEQELNNNNYVTFLTLLHRVDMTVFDMKQTLEINNITSFGKNKLVSVDVDHIQMWIDTLEGRYKK